MRRLRLPLPLPLLLLPTLLATACGGQQLSQSWQLDRLRILGVRAEPAEPRPGEAVSFEALYYLPDAEAPALSIWFACLPSAADDFGCSLDPTVLEDLAGVDLESLTPEEQAALYQQLLDAGLIGAEPLIAPTWLAPADALDGLDERERLEGVSAIVNITAIPEGAVDDSDMELAFKRVPISEATTPNHNPDVTGFLVDGQAVSLDGTVQALWGQPLQVEPVLSEDSVETYTYRTESGADEERVEEPYVSWFAEAGSFDQTFGLHPYLDAEWTPPDPEAVGGFAPYYSEEVRQVGLIAVIRDRRGGMGWGRLTVELAGPSRPPG